MVVQVVLGSLSRGSRQLFLFFAALLIRVFYALGRIKSITQRNRRCTRAPFSLQLWLFAMASTWAWARTLSFLWPISRAVRRAVDQK